MAELHEDIKTVLEQHQPMATTWVLAFETAEIDDDGDLSGSWGFVTSSPPTLGHLGLANAVTREVSRGYHIEGDDDDN